MIGSNVRARQRGIAARRARLHKRRRCCRVHTKARTGAKGSGCGSSWDGASSGLCVDVTGGAQGGWDVTVMTVIQMGELFPQVIFLR